MIQKKEFYSDLTKMLISTNIPIFKIENYNFENFLKKYTNFNLPDRTTLTKSYIYPLYNEVIESIKKQIGLYSINILIDEIFDITGRSVLNICIQILNEHYN